MLLTFEFEILLKLIELMYEYKIEIQIIMQIEHLPNSRPLLINECI